MAAIEGSQIQTASKEETLLFLAKLQKKKDLRFEVEANNAVLWGRTDNQAVLFFKKPLIFPEIPSPFSLQAYLQLAEEHEAKPLLFLAQASGTVALAYYDQDELLHHKVIRKYTQRKKQGKSQLKHLKTKGKSRLGSRIRLQQTKQLIEETHQKIREWDVLNEATHILVSCDIQLWTVMHEEQYKPAFSKKDERIIKIPLDLEEPNLKQLKYVFKYANKSYIETKF